MSQNPFLISPGALAEIIGRTGLSIVDASWYLPAQGRHAKAEFEAGHVPGAVFFDQDDIVDPGASLPHTLPPPDVFADKVGALGLCETDTLVVYDGMGLFSAPRVWWMLRTFGARDVRILDGGYPAWIEGGHPVETGPMAPTPRSFTPTFDREAVAGLEDMREFVANGERTIVDARPSDRFSGSVPEPRPGVRSGHMPGSANLPFLQLQENGRLKSESDLRALMEAAGVKPDAPAVTSCGSGVTAAVINLAFETLGNRDVKLYDGSWSEWGAASDTDVESGR
ncbi:3-mercaptopyruvate sulfurtransferase [Fulvimarina sp. 2208YS6-2-32]|uniref:Sulfurtransferase n=1 Tax=Fulvimarina uroteuthidis TaxID=3098149 RepID=A0ABU5I0D5_9HYPH|nr:3-mercaptopyruvate sulfurtransferase [Fulvimarina sp. 2208YS6-2-32]MDY8108218.1 3-mercaptopyruvate sulfurtransferase [Fulvimarina sp. 2208YS6-2-32]